MERRGRYRGGVPSDPGIHYPTPGQMYLRLEEALELLAASGQEQEAWARLPSSFRVPPDEMRLQYLDLIPSLLYLYREGRLIDDADEASLLRLESFLMQRPSDDVKPYSSWSGFAESTEWVRIRELATAALASLRRPPAEKAIPAS
jgi:hypothetical protein